MPFKDNLRQKEYQRIYREKNKNYFQEYYLVHCKKLREAQKLWSKNNPENRKNSYVKWRKNNPWFIPYVNAKQRCNNTKNPKFQRYGGRGIKFLLTLKEIMELWFKDEAFKMKQPSIDRIDNNGNYEYVNCQFIEMVENSRKGAKTSILSKGSARGLKRSKSLGKVANFKEFQYCGG